MATTTINSWKVDGEHLTIDATIKDTKYRGEVITVHLQGTGTMKDVLEGFVGQQKISHSGKIEARAYDEVRAKADDTEKWPPSLNGLLNNKTDNERRKLVKARTMEIARKEIHESIVNPFNLDVTPLDLGQLFEHVPADFQGTVRSMYEAHGIQHAIKLATAFEFVEEGWEPTDDSEPEGEDTEEDDA